MRKRLFDYTQHIVRMFGIFIEYKASTWAARAFDNGCAGAPTAPRKHARSALSNRCMEISFCAHTLQIASLEIKDGCRCIVHVFHVGPHLCDNGEE